MRPFFSVIIPTLNEEKYLPKLLGDLTKQTYNQFEVIVVDGKSDDKTAEVVKKFSNQILELRLIISEKRNVPYQRNLGAKSAKGAFFVFFDADVRIPQEFLEGIHYAIISKNLKFVTTWLLPDSKSSSDSLMQTLANVSIELAKTIEKPFSPGFNTIVNREAFYKVKGYNERITISEDHDFAIRVCKAGYDLAILKDPKLTPSLRRYRSEGMLRLFQKYAKVNIYFLLNGPITKRLVDYPMGGHVHKLPKRKKQTLMKKINGYYNKMNQLQKKLMRLLEY